jgi:hypothetical protein
MKPSSATTTSLTTDAEQRLTQLAPALDALKAISLPSPEAKFMNCVAEDLTVKDVERLLEQYRNLVGVVGGVKGALAHVEGRG